MFDNTNIAVAGDPWWRPARGQDPLLSVPAQSWSCRGLQGERGQISDISFLISHISFPFLKSKISYLISHILQIKGVETSLKHLERKRSQILKMFSDEVLILQKCLINIHISSLSLTRIILYLIYISNIICQYIIYISLLTGFPPVRPQLHQRSELPGESQETSGVLGVWKGRNTYFTSTFPITNIYIQYSWKNIWIKEIL